MHALGCSADEALERMREVSQRSNIRATEVARRVIDAHSGRSGRAARDSVTQLADLASRRGELRRIGSAMAAPDSAAPGDLGDLKSRAAALRQAAALPQADQQVLLAAALAELDGAVAALDESAGNPAAVGEGGQAASGLHSERRLLHAIFTATPVPLYVVDHDGTVLRANIAASELLGVGPGYATGRSLAALVDPSVRAALRSQLAAAARTGIGTRLGCGMLADTGLVRCQLEIRPLTVRGDADRLLVAVTPG